MHDPKKEYIRQLAKALSHNKKTMVVTDLADHLNKVGFRTSYNTKYSGGRGTYTLLKATYDWLHDEVKHKDDAGKVAYAFVDQNGNPAWDK